MLPAPPSHRPPYAPICSAADVRIVYLLALARDVQALRTEIAEALRAAEAAAQRLQPFAEVPIGVSKAERVATHLRELGFQVQVQNHDTLILSGWAGQQ